MSAARQRRTQEERSTSTREKVIRGTIDCIVEEGLQATTAARIAARSGVSWGAIVHQFGDKDALLHAVVEHNVRVFSGLLDDALRHVGPTLSERVAALVDVTWQYINEPSAFAFNELIIHNRVAHNPRIQQQQEDLSNAWTQEIWERFLGEFHIPPRTLETARNLTMGALLGLSIMRLISQNAQPLFQKEVAALKRQALEFIATSTPSDESTGEGHEGSRST